MKRKAVSLSLAITFIFLTVFSVSFVASADDNGSCGTGIKYSFTSADGVMTISGSGKMKNYLNVGSAVNCPWKDYKQDIKKVIFTDGVQSVGNYSFYGCTQLTQVIISDTVTDIGNNAFDECSKLSQVTIGNKVQKISGNAFNNTAITSIVLPESVSDLGLYSFGNCSFLSEVTVHNPECKFSLNVFYNSSQTITFWGHSGSTTQQYVADYPNSNYVFKSLDPCDHTNTKDVVTKEATCTEKGVTSKQCVDCGFVLSETEIPAKGHTFVIKEEDDKSKIDGHIYKTYICDVCDEIQNVIEHVDFIDGYYTYSNTATCTRAGTETKSCNVAGCSKVERSISPKLNHQITSPDSRVEPTCTTDGSETGKCAICNETVTQTIPKTGHKNELVDTIDNTAEDGHIYDFYKCSVCGAEDAVLHHISWVDNQYDSQTVTEPKCVIDGSRRDTCRLCGEKRLVAIPSNGKHEWQETGRTEPTCIANGKVSYVCSVCNNTKSETLPATGHDFVLDEANSLAPTCTQSGSNFYKCSKCSASKSEAVKALGHTAKEGTSVVTKEATCTQEGEVNAQCSVCNEQYTMPIAPLGHDYVDTFAPISDKPGHSMVTPCCSRCQIKDTAYVKHIDWIEGDYTTTVVTQGSCTVSEITRDTCKLCGETRTNTVEATGHKYAFDGLNAENRLSYTCSVCSNVYTADPAFAKNTVWKSTFINTAPNEKAMGYLFDLNNDGVINAKDYAILVKSAKTTE